MPIPVTGFVLREAVGRAERRLVTLIQRFPDVIHKFPDEDKPTPQALDEQIAQASARASRLKAAQQYFNQIVLVQYNGQRRRMVELLQEIKALGSREKQWRKAAAGKRDRWSEPKLERANDVTLADRQVTHEEASQQADRIAALASQCREAMARGNSQNVGLPDMMLVDGDLA